MYCENCGKERIGEETFCEGCKNPFSIVNSTLKPSDIKDNLQQESDFKQSDSASSLKTVGSITLNDKTLQWMYEFSFWKNPTILVTVAKVLLISLLVPTTLMFFITLGEGFTEAFQVSMMIFGGGLILMSLLLAIAYPLLAIYHGGKYFVLFKMDDEGVNHIQLDKQYKKAQALGFLTALLGLSTGNLAVGGAGLMAATKQSLYTRFKKVKSIKSVKSRNTIYVNEFLTRNQIYATKEDFDFVLNHIISHCSDNVKVTNK